MFQQFQPDACAAGYVKSAGYSAPACPSDPVPAPPTLVEIYGTLQNTRDHTGNLHAHVQQLIDSANGVLAALTGRGVSEPELSSEPTRDMPGVAGEIARVAYEVRVGIVSADERLNTVDRILTQILQAVTGAVPTGIGTLAASPSRF